MSEQTKSMRDIIDEADSQTVAIEVGVVKDPANASKPIILAVEGKGFTPMTTEQTRELAGRLLDAVKQVSHQKMLSDVDGGFSIAGTAEVKDIEEGE